MAAGALASLTATRRRRFAGIEPTRQGRGAAERVDRSTVAGRTDERVAAKRASQPVPIAVDSPPPPQRTIPESHYVPVERDDFARAHQWAREQVARKYPGATEILSTLESLIKQQLAGN